MSYKSKIPILVNYQGAHDPNFPSFPLGTEYSHNYSDNKGVFFYIYDESMEVAVGLKAFITDFSINTQFEQETIKDPGGDVDKVKGIGINYKIGLNVPAISANDARVNATRMETLGIMLNKTVGSGAAADPTVEIKYILLSNLIHNGKYTKKIDVKTAGTIKKYGLICYLNDLTYTVETDMGFFEYKEKLWPKVFSLSLDFVASQTYPQPMSGGIMPAAKNLIRSLTDGGGISDKEVYRGKWPFGISTL
tara:strand:- start:1030 stop:1776 length:747 start_codon:yes stop_codon:yes gene_type:complete